MEWGRLVRCAEIGFFVFLITSLGKTALASRDQKQLIEELFATNQYDRIVRPVLLETRPINVTIGFYLQQVNRVNEKQQTLSTTVWLTQRWRDEYLTWEPERHSNLSSLRIPADKLWLPDTILYNTRDPSSGHLVTPETLVVVDSDGVVEWSSPMTLTSECCIDVFMYPFDHHTCRLTLSSWRHDHRTVTYLPGSAFMAKDHYHGDWHVRSVTASSTPLVHPCCPDKEHPAVSLTISLSRKPLFYVVSLVVPCVVLSFMSMLTFVLPCDSGEKVSLEVAVLVSVTVFMLVVADKMPPSGDSLPILARYYMVTVLLVSFSLLLTVVVLALHHRRASPPPWVQHVFLNVLASILCIKVPSIVPCRTDRRVPGRGGGSGHHGHSVHFELVPQIINTASLSASPADYTLKEDPLVRVSCCGEADPMRTRVFGAGTAPCAAAHHSSRASWADRALLDIQKDVSFLVSRSANHEHDTRVTADWRNVARVVDRFFLVIYVVCVILMDIVMVLQIN